MPSGTLGQSAPAATTNTTIYTVPSSTLAVVTINALNRGTDPATVRLAVSATSTPGNSEWIEHDTIVPAKGVLERTGIAMGAGKLIVAHCSTANFTINVYGMEELV